MSPTDGQCVRIRQIRDTSTPAWARTLNSCWVNSNFSIVHTHTHTHVTRPRTPSHFEIDCVTMQNAYRCSRSVRVSCGYEYRPVIFCGCNFLTVLFLFRLLGPLLELNCVCTFAFSCVCVCVCVFFFLWPLCSAFLPTHFFVGDCDYDAREEVELSFVEFQHLDKYLICPWVKFPSLRCETLRLSAPHHITY